MKTAIQPRPKYPIYILFIILYVGLLILQIHQRPFERYPEWDHFWVDVQAAGKLSSLQHSVAQLEFPAIDPHTNFGWDLGGDHHSFWGILNLLILFLSPSAVMIISQMFILLLGALGAFFYLKLLTKNEFLSFLGGILYISLPFTISLNYYSSSLADFNLVPLLLLLLHRLGNNFSRSNLLIFVFYCAVAIGLADITFLLICFTVIPIYSFSIGIWYDREPLFLVMRKSFLLSFLALLAGSFYLVPLLYNLFSIGKAVTVFKEMGIVSLGSLGQKIDFLSYFIEKHGLESLYRPVEGVGMILYLPTFFYVIILLSFIFRRVIFPAETHRFPIVLILLALGALMFLINFAFYNPLTAILFPGIREGATGVLRFHLHLLPFLGLLAAVVCVSELNKIKNLRIKIGIYTVIIVSSLLADLDLSSNLPAVLDRPYGSSNSIPIPISNPLHLIPYINLAVILLLAIGNLDIIRKRPLTRKSAFAGGILLAMFVPLLGVSNYNEWFATGQQGRQPPLTRNPYRWKTYLERKECIDKIISRYDPNFRTLYAGKGRVSPNDGRDWKLIAETELHVAGGEKVLFSYREFDHPFTGLLRGTFRKEEKTFNRAKLMPPLSREVSGNLNLIRLMGVKWVISADEEIVHPELAYRGKCFSREGPKGLQGGEKEEGYLYLYELLNPLETAFLVGNYQKMDIQKSLRIIYEGMVYPWLQEVVYLETDPVSAASLFPNRNQPAGKTESEAKITRESFAALDISLNTPKQKFLVLTYIFRPFWKASIDGKQTKIYRAYGGFMSISVPPGQHLIEFRYRPYDIYLGLILAFIAFLSPFAIIRKIS